MLSQVEVSTGSQFKNSVDPTYPYRMAL